MIKKIPSRDFLDVVGNVQEMLRQLMTISRLIFNSNYGKIRERNSLNDSKRLIIHFMVDRKFNESKFKNLLVLPSTSSKNLLGTFFVILT